MKKIIMFLISACLSISFSPIAFANSSISTTLYAPDGRTADVANTSVADWEAVGWYKNKSDVCTTMYTPDGRTEEVFNVNVADWKAVGWYSYPVTIMYALDGRTMVVSKDSIDANKSVGWYLYGEDYVCNRADQIILSGDYYKAFDFVRAQLNSLDKNSELREPFCNKATSILQQWHKHTGHPIAIGTNIITENSIGTPEANIEFLNISDKEISSFEVVFTCYDAYGKQTSDFYHSGRFTGVADRISLPAHNVKVYTWSLYSNERTSSIGNIRVTKVAFSDGTTWYR